MRLIGLLLIKVPYFGLIDCRFPYLMVALHLFTTKQVAMICGLRPSRHVPRCAAFVVASVRYFETTIKRPWHLASGYAMRVSLLLLHSIDCLPQASANSDSRDSTAGDS